MLGLEPCQPSDNLGDVPPVPLYESLPLERGTIQLAEGELARHRAQATRPLVIVIAMEFVSQIAPEVDRLVLSVNGRVTREHGDRILAVARQNGLESTALIGQLAPFMAAGTLTRDLGVLRMRYLPPEQLIARIDELEKAGMLEQTDGSLSAGAGLGAVLDEGADALREVAADQWGDQRQAVEEASAVARRVGDAATPDHVVAVVHREVPEPADPFPLLHQRLVTLRFVRQHDHAEAWLEKGLTPTQMVALTDLWHGKETESSPVIDELRGRGLVDLDPIRLSGEGLTMRQEIEDETNRRNAETFSVLSDAEAEAFLTALQALPGTA